ncbi:MAG: AAA family ATPase [Actinobacteria bacterium]|nr:AAA family ATPase [Actinomycetota bacterium]MBU1943247.1 AAA family ATPase [Actinomycetota bacterium]MBU2685969.1 AAA family ATPase [Actinomycetota bacterium]
MPRSEGGGLRAIDVPDAINLLLTGKPGSGKTTIVRSVLASRGDAGGFFTGEMREAGTRTGFSITTLDGREGVLARKGLRSPVKVGCYGVNIEDVEGVAASALEDALDDGAVRLLVIDEIAAMEIASGRFRRAVIRALDDPRPVLGTIQLRSNQFLDLVRAREDVAVLHVTSVNRDELPAVVEEWLRRTVEV